eukprot:scaffold3759_cov124-Skeletonema_dohrnii-CCMP3373.AAC.2
MSPPDNARCYYSHAMQLLTYVLATKRRHGMANCTALSATNLESEDKVESRCDCEEHSFFLFLWITPMITASMPNQPSTPLQLTANNCSVSVHSSRAPVTWTWLGRLGLGDLAGAKCS